MLIKTMVLVFLFLNLLPAAMANAKKEDANYFKIQGSSKGSSSGVLSIQLLEGRIVVFEKWLTSIKELKKFEADGVFFRTEPPVNILGKTMWLRIKTLDEKDTWKGSLQLSAILADQVQIPILKGDDPEIIDGYASWNWPEITAAQVTAARTAAPPSGGKFSHVKVDIPMYLFNDITSNEITVELLYGAKDGSLANRSWQSGEWNYYNGQLELKLKPNLNKTKSAEYKVKISFTSNGTISAGWKSDVKIMTYYDETLNGTSRRVVARLDEKNTELPTLLENNRFEYAYKCLDITKKPFAPALDAPTPPVVVPEVPVSLAPQ